MENSETIIFIDSNQYLELYRTVTGKKLLGAITEQRTYIFVTTQVAEEVQRRKVSVAAEFLGRQFAALALRNFKIPDHLFGTIGESAKETSKLLQELHDRIKSTNQALENLAHELLDQVSRSEDEVSKVLSEIFVHSVSHKAPELERARLRKELARIIHGF